MDRAAQAKAQWKRELPRLDMDPMVLIGRLAEVQHLMAENWLEPIFKSNGLKRGEFDVLATLRRAGAPYALTPTQLYQSTMVSSGGMTARIDRLEKNSYIERTPHPTDRRALIVVLSPKGKKLIDQMMPAYVQAQHDAVSSLTSAQQKTLSTLLATLVENLEAPD